MVVCSNKSSTTYRQQSQLTDFRHLGDAGEVDLLCELWRVVVDVVNFYVKFSVRLQLCVGVPVQHLRNECVHSFLFPVQSLGGMNVSGLLIDQEQGACPISCQNVLHVAVTFVHIGVQLKNEERHTLLVWSQTINQVVLSVLIRGIAYCSVMHLRQTKKHSCHFV